MKVKSVLVSQPRPAVIEKSPFYELSQKHHVEIAYRPFIRVEGVSLKEFRAQRVEILTHTAVIFTSRTTVDSFFHICEEARITVPETMKYICQTEAVALYLQKYIVYRKRKISFADGSFTSLIELIIKHKEEKFLLALSEPHKPELPETLAKLKLSFDPVILARTVAGDLDDVKMADYDLLALYSPSDVKTLIEKFGTDGLPAVAVFGEGTLRAALGAGITVLANAPTPEAPSMVKAIDIYLQKVQKGEEIEPVELVTDARKEEFIRSQQHKLAKKGRTPRNPVNKGRKPPAAMSAHSLPRTERLRSLGAVRRLFESGESGFIFPFRYVWFAEPDTEQSVEVLFSVPKKFHKRANKRNLVRRRTKEAYRLQKQILHDGRPVNLDLALIYSSKETLPYKTVANAVRRILESVVEHL